MRQANLKAAVRVAHVGNLNNVFASVVICDFMVTMILVIA